MAAPRPGAGPGEIAQGLAALLGPAKVLGDGGSLDRYARDMGLYRVRPQVVVLPTEAEDVDKVLAFARQRGIPITPRAGGTSLSGAAVGPGIVLDVSRCNRILALDPRARRARCEAGVGLRQLAAALAPLGLFFPPDPGSEEWCRLGGMVGHNASGPHSVKYGSTKDYVEALEVLLANGHWVTARAYGLDEPALARLLAAEPGLRGVLDLVEANLDLLAARRPRAAKNASGYNLFDLAEGMRRGIFDLPKLFVGSEGTLGIVMEVELRLLPRPPAKVTLLAFFDALDALGRAVVELLALGPSALEVVDGNSMDLLGRDRFGLPTRARAMLLIEFDEGDLKEQAARAEAICASHGSAPLRVAWGPEGEEELWRARRHLLLRLQEWPGREKPWTCAEDVAVPPARIPELIEALQALTERLGLRAGLYGHVGDGNIHYRPLFDLAAPGGEALFRRIYDEVHGLALALGGTPTAEHGDGRQRQRLLERFFGPEVVGLFRRTKALLDPQGLLNPGVKLGDRDVLEGVDPRAAAP